MIRVSIASDIRLFREGLSVMLDRRANFEVVATASDWDETISGLHTAAAHIVLLDMAMPQAKSIVRDLAHRAPELHVVALGVSERPQDVLSCAEAGIAAYAHRESSVDELAQVIESAFAGELHCSPQVAAALLRRVAALASSQHELEPPRVLTSRELQVAELLDQGLTNKEIAKSLGIQLSTTKNHVHNILDKVGGHNRSEAVSRLRRSGYLRPQRAAAAFA